ALGRPDGSARALPGEPLDARANTPRPVPQPARARARIGRAADGPPLRRAQPRSRAPRRASPRGGARRARAASRPPAACPPAARRPARGDLPAARPLGARAGAPRLEPPLRGRRRQLAPLGRNLADPAARRPDADLPGQASSRRPTLRFPPRRNRARERDGYLPLPLPRPVAARVLPLAAPAP